MTCDPRRQRQLQKLILRLGLPETSPVQWRLLDIALIHPTYSTTVNYEQLEFVGDAVIRLTVAELLWDVQQTSSVGEWSAIRSILVSDRILADLALYYDLEKYLLIGPSAVSDVKGQESRLAQSFESLLAALYLSTQNLNLIRVWLRPHLQRLAQEVRADPAYQNYKAALQTWSQAQYQVLPEYSVQETGQPQDHNRFTAEVRLQGKCWGQGTGKSIKAAEKAAAQAAFLKLQAESSAKSG